MSKSVADLPPVDSLTYEQALAELETVVATLETEQQALTDALVLYERGQALAKRCVDLLDQAELIVQQLNTSNQTEISPPD